MLPANQLTPINTAALITPLKPEQWEMKKGITDKVTADIQDV